jgi:SAM-dependent methyltransferase
LEAILSIILEKDLVMGTFTHRETYLPNLCASIRNNLPNILFIPHLDNLPINKNFNALREKFIRTGKRFWLFLDDDIQFLFPNTIEVALKTLISNKYALVGVYSTFIPDLFFNRQDLKEKETNWVPGYFQLVDSSLIGHIKADEDLPDPNTSIDTSYCVQIKQEGYKIGIAPTYVYHTYKKFTWVKQEVIEPTNQYLMKKYEQQYFDWVSSSDVIIGGAPEDILSKNRQKLISWQQSKYVPEEGQLKLHLGCGDLRYSGYINCDISGNVDKIYDITKRSEWSDNSIDHITCHHVLEHVHYRSIPKVLKEWHRILKIGGIVDIGMPDINLLCKDWLEATEERRWNWLIHVFYGQQGTTTKLPSLLTDDDPIIEGQCHKGALTRERLCLLLTDLGFSIVDSYNYDGNGNPSLFVLARKEK